MRPAALLGTPSACSRVGSFWSIVVATGVAIVVFSVSAQAQTDGDVTRARELFRQGIELSDRGAWDEAEARFREVLLIKAAPPVVFNLAVALQEQGEYPEAGALLEGLLADPEATNDIKVACQELLGKMNSSGGKLKVELSGSAEGAVVALDGYDAAADGQGQSVWLKSGAHRVEIRRPGAEPMVQEVEIEPGVRRTLQIHLVPSPREAARSATPAGKGVALPKLVKDWRFWAVAGGVAAVVTVIVIVAVVASAPYSGDFDPGKLIFP